MKGTRFDKLHDQLVSSYWFVPVLMTVSAIVLGAVLSRLDQTGEAGKHLLSWAGNPRPEDARALLITIASASITIASLTFSITIVALTLASSQFGPRLLYNFMRDRANQVVLGAFVGIFAYCLVVLQAISAVGDETSVPRFAIATALVLSLIGVGVLIFFIHHVANSIQATSVIAAVSRELCVSIDRALPEVGAEREPADIHPHVEAQAPRHTIHSIRGGIVQAIDLSGLVSLAVEHDVCFRLRRRPGHYIIAGAPLVEYWATAPAGGDFADRTRLQFVLGSRRTLIQDVEFAVLQLVEIALRALSPGINDPFTAVSCIDELGSALARIMGRDDLRDVAVDADGTVRVHLDVTSFEGLTNAAFDQIRQHSRGHVAIVIRMLDVLCELTGMARRPEHVAALRRQAEAVHADAIEQDLAEIDAADIRARFEDYRRVAGA